MTIFTDQYEFAVTLLLLSDEVRFVPLDEKPDEDVYDRLTARS